MRVPAVQELGVCHAGHSQLGLGQILLAAEQHLGVLREQEGHRKP